MYARTTSSAAVSDKSSAVSSSVVVVDAGLGVVQPGMTQVRTPGRPCPLMRGTSEEGSSCDSGQRQQESNKARTREVWVGYCGSGLSSGYTSPHLSSAMREEETGNGARNGRILCGPDAMGWEGAEDNTANRGRFQGGANFGMFGCLELAGLAASPWAKSALANYQSSHNTPAEHLQIRRLYGIFPCLVGVEAADSGPCLTSGHKTGGAADCCEGGEDRRRASARCGEDVDCRESLPCAEYVNQNNAMLTTKLRRAPKNLRGAVDPPYVMMPPPGPTAPPRLGTGARIFLDLFQDLTGAILSVVGDVPLDSETGPLDPHPLFGPCSSILLRTAHEPFCCASAPRGLRSPTLLTREEDCNRPTADAQRRHSQARLATGSSRVVWGPWPHRHRPSGQCDIWVRSRRRSDHHHCLCSTALQVNSQDTQHKAIQPTEQGGGAKCKKKPTRGGVGLAAACANSQSSQLIDCYGDRWGV
nr:unnamed protein product [Digitaria exilis]